MSLADYIIYCCTGQLPNSILSVKNKSQFLSDLVCMAELLGVLEPACATRPGVCDPVVVVDRDITLPVATINEAGQTVPSEALAIPICAPMNRALVIKTLRLLPADLTAAEFGEVEFKKVNLGGFGEWCLAFEPQGGPGLFVNVEHIITPPAGGFSLHAKNHSTANQATFHLHAEMWACC
jgi:hypothetical protein